MVVSKLICLLIPLTVTFADNSTEGILRTDYMSRDKELSGREFMFSAKEVARSNHFLEIGKGVGPEWH